MRFIDEAKIKIAAGKGGPGCVSFRRETFTPRGGPNGGDGGAGGDIIFVASRQLTTLQDFRFKRVYGAPNGEHGSGTNKAGCDGDDLFITIPVGTTVKDADSGELLYDFKEHGEKWIACKGGRGGKGNAHFVSSTFQAPKFAQPGEVGTFREIVMELKLLADAAIVGFPNAGKSTLISHISAARPKIADYAFTTLTPNLGVVDMHAHKSFVIADIPGLIEGAHRGMGLGHRFLKHLERTRVFVHMLDGSSFLEDATKPGLPGFNHAVEALAKRYETIRRELELYNPELLDKPEILVLNKLDLLEADPELVTAASRALREVTLKIRGEKATSLSAAEEPFIISAATGRGLDPLKNAIFAEIERHKTVEEAAAQALETPEDGSAKDAATGAAILMPDHAKIRSNKGEPT